MRTEVNHDEILKKITDNYKSIEASLVNELRIGVRNIILHPERSENMCGEQIVPRKFAIEQSVFIVDSSGKVSREVDLVIFDEQYTPYIFRYGNIKYIPIEAVAVVVQCKSTNVVSQELGDWLDSIKDLRTSLRSIVRQFSFISCGEFDLPRTGEKIDKKTMTQSSTRPIYILCHTSDSSPEKVKKMFDFILHPKGEGLHIHSKPSVKLSEWHSALNHVDMDQKNQQINYKLVDDQRIESFDSEKWKDFSLDHYKIMDGHDEFTIMSFIFQLNQLLMLINNPLPFPHLAYVEMFNHVIETESDAGADVECT